jgi:hypothetical protein
MDIQVNRHQLERVVIKWLNQHYGNLIQKKHTNVPRTIFYVNSKNEIIMEYDYFLKNRKDIHVDNERIWSKLQSIFHLKYLEVQSIIKVWLKETYGLDDDDVTPLKNDWGFDEITDWEN